MANEKNVFKKNPVPPKDNTLTEAELLKEQDNIIQNLLKLACDTSSLDGKSLKEKIDNILEIRIKYEVMINQLLNDQIDIPAAAAINNRNKDSVTELIRVKQLLEGLPTERISVEDDENQFRFSRLRDMRGNAGTPDLGSAN